LIEERRQTVGTRQAMLAVVLVVAAAGVCSAATDEQLAAENEELKARVERLEKELSEIKGVLEKREAAPAIKPKAEELAEIEERVTKLEEKKPVTSGLDIELYGYIKADASYDTSRTNPGNYVVWVDRENQNSNDDEFNMTANETRLGMRIKGPEEEGVQTAGRVEFDFYGSDAAENKAKIQMRHAYMTMDWPEEQFSILAGQTSDIFSPLVPRTLNYTVLWDAGNIGYRRPQIRLTKGMPFGDESNLKLEGGVARTIGRDTGAPANSESGEDAGYPSLQGRASATFPWFGPKATTVGVSGHYGREEYDLNTSGTSNKKFESWSVNLDLTQPVSDDLTIKGEWFTGQNLNTYFGGIGQGVNTTLYKEIGSTGGWLAASLGPYDKWSFNLGVGMDDVDTGDLNSGDRTMNRCVFGNVLYSVNTNTEVGFELSHWRTEYKGNGDAEALRAQGSFIYKF